MTRLFVEACASGDMRGLLSLLSEDVGEKGCATTDQGGKDEGAGDNELGGLAATSRGDGGEVELNRLAKAVRTHRKETRGDQTSALAWELRRGAGILLKLVRTQKNTR